MSSKVRTFRTIDGEGNEDIITYLDSKIQVEYNMFGFYYKNENYNENLFFYKKARKDYVADWLEEGCDFCDLKELIEEFQERYEYDCHKFISHTGRPSKFIKYESDEMVGDVEGFYNIDLSHVVEGEMEKHEFVELWGGNQWERHYLTGVQAENNGMTTEIK